MSNLLVDKLREYQEQGRLIGFYPWPEGDAMMWGYVLSLTAKTVTFKLIDTDGSIEEVKSYALSRIYGLEEDPVYSERLRRLAAFTATAPNKTKSLRARSSIYEALTEARKSGEVFRVRFAEQIHDETVRCLEFDDRIVTLQAFDERMRSEDLFTCRKSFIRVLRWRDRACECDQFLLTAAPK